MHPIITATKEDLPELMELYRSLFDTPGCTWSDDYPTEDIISADLLAEHLFCMKNDEGKIIAAISIENDPAVACLTNWTIPSDTVMEISRVAVHKDYHGNGIARMMICYAMEYLKQQHYEGAHFLVSQHNLRALMSYAPLGFTCCGHSHIFDHDWYCYEKRF